MEFKNKKLEQFEKDIETIENIKKLQKILQEED